jgi:hypothetical protein
MVWVWARKALVGPALEIITAQPGVVVADPLLVTMTDWEVEV